MSRAAVIALVVVLLIVAGLLALGFKHEDRPLTTVEKPMLNETGAQ
ncbi:hypothetical protein [Sphingomonas crocodyli]|nr:hypothetical protein [Sphingomonas crocodyli]